MVCSRCRTSQVPPTDAGARCRLLSGHADPTGWPTGDAGPDRGQDCRDDARLGRCQVNAPRWMVGQVVPNGAAPGGAHITATGYGVDGTRQDSHVAVVTGTPLVIVHIESSSDVSRQLGVDLARRAADTHDTGLSTAAGPAGWRGSELCRLAAAQAGTSVTPYRFSVPTDQNCAVPQPGLPPHRPVLGTAGPRYRAQSSVPHPGNPDGAVSAIRTGTGLPTRGTGPRAAPPTPTRIDETQRHRQRAGDQPQPQTHEYHGAVGRPWQYRPVRSAAIPVPAQHPCSPVRAASSRGDSGSNDWQSLHLGERTAGFDPGHHAREPTVRSARNQRPSSTSTALPAPSSRVGTASASDLSPVTEDRIGPVPPSRSVPGPIRPGAGTAVLTDPHRSPAALNRTRTRHSRRGPLSPRARGTGRGYARSTPVPTWTGTAEPGSRPTATTTAASGTWTCANPPADRAGET
jgi:hypothetical protein